MTSACPCDVSLYVYGYLPSRFVAGLGLADRIYEAGPPIEDWVRESESEC